MDFKELVNAKIKDQAKGPENIEVDEQLDASEIFQGFLKGKIAVPPSLKADFKNRNEISVLEAIFIKMKNMMFESPINATEFAKLINLIIEKAYSKESKKDDKEISSLGEVPQEDLLNTIIQSAKYLNKENLVLAQSAIEAQLLIKRSENAVIINQD